MGIGGEVEIKSKVGAKDKKEKLAQLKEEKIVKLEQATKSFHAGEFTSLRQAAIAYGVNYNTLYDGVIKRGGEFKGKGNFTTLMTPDKEKKIKDHVIWRAQIGYGVDWEMLSLLIQEVLLSVKKSNPGWVTGLEDTNQLPNKSYVRRFADRHNLVMRTTMGISKGRQVVSEEELGLWQKDTWAFFSSHPELVAALQVNIIS